MRPNGSPAANYIPCPDSRVCCLVNEACLSNGLCYGSRYNIAYRGACTDSDWPDSECPRICYTEVSSSFADTRACPGNARGFSTCGPSGWVTEICEWNLSTFRWPPAPVVVAQLVNGSSTGMAAETGTQTVTVTASMSVSVTATTDADSDVGAEADPAAAAGGSGGAGGGDCLDTERRLGAGLGLGLGIPLLAVDMAAAINAAGVFGSMENKARSDRGRGSPGLVGELPPRGLLPELQVLERDTHELQ
ncbi:hypothetical protein BJY00DRAFT_314245 [Aspergillus carlsbadensis]|nr:hypothetical protein BJY00DRAFT_314245 [Aspergillus carlsbadensis]